MRVPTPSGFGESLWSDTQVRRWLEEHASAISIDPIKDADAAGTLSLGGPVIVAYKNGKEFDRVDVRQSPASLLYWFNQLLAGDRSIELWVDPRPGSESDAAREAIMPLWAEAVRHTQAGRLTDAGNCYMWLWHRMREHRCLMVNATGGNIKGMIRDTVARCAATRRSFAMMRDAARARIGGEKVKLDDVADWASLNRILGEESATLAWFDEIKNDRRRQPLVNHVASQLRGPLIAKGRWADVGRIVTDPNDWLELYRWFDEAIRNHHAPEGRLADLPRRWKEAFDTEITDDIAQIYAGLLAAGNDDAALAFADRAREWFGAAPMSRALVRWALIAGQPRQAHIAWLSGDPSDGEAAALRAQVESALKIDKRRSLAQPLPHPLRLHLPAQPPVFPPLFRAFTHPNTGVGHHHQPLLPFIRSRCPDR